MARSKQKMVQRSLILENIDKLAEKGELSTSKRGTYTSTLSHLRAVKATYGHLIMGGTYSAALAKLAKDDFNIGREYKGRTADGIILDAKELIKADFEQDRENAREKIFMCLQDIYTECRENHDRQTAIKALDNMAKLVGLYEQPKQSVSIKTNDSEIVIDFGLNSFEEKKEEDIQDVEIIDEQ